MLNRRRFLAASVMAAVAPTLPVQAFAATPLRATPTVGKLAIAGREMTFNQSCYALQGANPVGDYFTYLVAQHMVGQLQSMAHGSVFSTITRQTFEAVEMPMASQPIFEAFEASMAPIFARILASVEETRTLAQTRDLLLPRLMSGELRVADLNDIGHEAVG